MSVDEIRILQRICAHNKQDKIRNAEIQRKVGASLFEDKCVEEDLLGAC